jgi:hypothetical protein
MKKLIFIIFLLFCLPAYSQNTCLVDAVVAKAVITEYSKLLPYYFTKVLVLEWTPEILKTLGNVSNSHAACVFQFQDKLFLYDPLIGSIEVSILFKDNPTLIAWEVYGWQNVKSAKYLEEQKPKQNLVDNAEKGLNQK